MYLFAYVGICMLVCMCLYMYGICMAIDEHNMKNIAQVHTFKFNKPSQSLINIGLETANWSPILLLILVIAATCVFLAASPGLRIPAKYKGLGTRLVYSKHVKNVLFLQLLAMRYICCFTYLSRTIILTFVCSS